VNCAAEADSDDDLPALSCVLSYSVQVNCAAEADSDDDLPVYCRTAYR